MERINMETKNDELFDNIEKSGFAKFIGMSREEYIRGTEEWNKRDVPKDVEDQIKKDCLAYCNYIIETLTFKKKFDMEEAKRLHQNVTRWKATNFPLKK